MLSILTQTIITQATVGLGDIVDIPYTQATLSDATTVTFTTPIVFGFYEGLTIAAEDGCFFPTVNDEGDTGGGGGDTGGGGSGSSFPPGFEGDHLNTQLKMVREDTLVFDIAVTLNGAVVDLTGGTLRMTYKWDVTDGDGAAIFVKTSPSGGIVILSAVNGTARVTIDPADTQSLPFHSVNLPYDIQLTDAGGAVYTVLGGRLQIIPDVSVTTP